MRVQVGPSQEQVKAATASATVAASPFSGSSCEGASCREIAASAAGASDNVAPALSAGHMWGKQLCCGAHSLGTCTRVQGVSIVSLTGTIADGLTFV
jgi:hypothetical protein